MKLYHITLALLLVVFTAQAQVPQAISFQGMALDASGGFIANQAVDVVVDLHSNSPLGTVIYSETHSVTTSDLGHFTIEIGRGTPDSSQLSFSEISWGATDYFAEISVGTSGGMSTSGTVHLVSVPYAFTALEAGNGIPGPNGANGLNGAQGPQGPQGAQGPPGPPGSGADCWDTNGNGIPDSNEDTNGDGVFDENDCIGPAGAQGPQGPKGPQGEPGPQGANVGAQGPRGPQGPRGDDYVGPPGIAGIDGPPGIDGFPGPQGPIGPQGPQGPAGPQGPQGPPGIGGGIPGPEGIVGPIGTPEGDAGDSGINCWDTNGNGINDAAEDINGDGILDASDCQGISGFQGPQGSQGPAGLAGLDGLDGTDGPSGLFSSPMLSTPPTTAGRGFYLDDGSNRADGLPGLRFWSATSNGWVD